MLTDRVIQDSRLLPLFAEDSVVQVQFFVLEVKRFLDSTSSYKILYGWCIKASDSTTLNRWFSSKENKIISNQDSKCSVHKLNLYCFSGTAIELINSLLECKTLVEGSDKLGLDYSAINFDFKLSEPENSGSFVLRPLIYNETKAPISRNLRNQKTYVSPYKTVPSVSLMICNLDKERLFSDLHNWKEELFTILKYLEEKTTIPFTDGSASRLGNIEFINTQCCDEFENHYVFFEAVKEKVSGHDRSKVVAKSIRVTILPNDFTRGKELIVNCFLTNGDQIIFNECKCLVPPKEQQVSIVFTAGEQISQAAVEIWVKSDESYRLWFRHSILLIRQLVTKMGMVHASGTVESDWLKIIKNSNRKVEHRAQLAEKFSKTAYTSYTIGDYNFDPWVKADREFVSLLDQLSPPKSEGGFFPKGWSEETDEHGAISFLEWFKSISGSSQRVVIQDPFFDTLGLEFLARSENSATEFIILTSTQIVSDDDTDKSELGEPNRAKRIRDFVFLNPLLFTRTKVEVYDLRSISGGEKKLLHDRYMLIFEGNRLCKGFHLSNSIQGATRLHPLLITPIPRDNLQRVDSYVSKIIYGTTSGGDHRLISLLSIEQELESEQEGQKEVADPTFLNELEKLLISDGQVNLENINTLIKRLSRVDTEEFSKLWSTFGSFLSNTTLASTIIKDLESRVTSELNKKLISYIESSIDRPWPNDLKGRHYFSETQYYTFHYEFTQALEYALAIIDQWGYGVGYCDYGIYYGVKVSCNTNLPEFLDLIQFIEEKQKGKRDLYGSPVAILNKVGIDRLIKSVFWPDKIDYGKIESCLKSQVILVRALAASTMILRSVSKKSDIDLNQAEFLLTKALKPEEALMTLCHIPLKYQYLNKQIEDTKERILLSFIADNLTHNFSENNLVKTFNLFAQSHYPLIEKKFTEHILLRLWGDKKITITKIFYLWTNHFMEVLDKFKSTNDYSGLLDITGWAICAVEELPRSEFMAELNKRFKKARNEIRTPFRRGSIRWEESFERLFLIQTVLVIASLYNKKNITKIDISNFMEMIKEIQRLDQEYRPNFELSSIQLFAKQMMDDFQIN